MNPSDLHDALTLLPSDLVLATDYLRTRSNQKVILWKRLVPIAACLVVLLSAALALYSLPVMGGGVKEDCTAEAPAAMAPARVESALETPAPAEEEENINDSHRHLFAEDSKSEAGTTGSRCGSAQATIYLDGREYALAGDDAITLTAILEKLPYDPAQVCRCAAQFTVDTELLDSIEVSLDNAFARCGQGQASLTQQQVQTIQEILDDLQ